VNLIQDDALPPAAFQERLRVLQQAADPGPLAIEIFDVGEALAEDGFSRAANARQPDDGPLPPDFLDLLQPKRARIHVKSIAYSVTKCK